VKALFAALCALASLAAQQSPFVRREVASADGAPRAVVDADARAIACLDALRGLAAACGWNLVVESSVLENDLRFATVDLSFADQDPRMAAQLIAIAAGADCLFDEAHGADGARATLHVVRTPSAETEAGRQRLRALADQWYRSFLRDELKFEALVQKEGVGARMSLGEVLVNNGDLAAAIPFFTEAWEQRPHDHVAAAALRLSRCHAEIAAGSRDAARRKAEFAKAEAWARRILDSMPSAPEAADATVLLGRALLGQATAAADPEVVREEAGRCQHELGARAARLVASPAMADVWLLTAEAQMVCERPDRVDATLQLLRASQWFGDLDERRFLDYHYLLGYGAHGSGNHDLALRALEWFLIHAGVDERVGPANVMLAESYLALDRYMQARAASTEARTRHLGSLAPSWRERAFKVWARSALALGDKEVAFQELEKIVLRDDEPELTLFLVDALLADRQWQRAMAVAAPWADRQGAVGDQARYRVVKALYDQATTSGHVDEFPALAVRLAPRIVDAELRSRCATMIGDAYTRIGKLEHAADAYRGILR
jgi:tetratricopeptide (TPR) repeat protein